MTSGSRSFPVSLLPARWLGLAFILCASCGGGAEESSPDGAVPAFRRIESEAPAGGGVKALRVLKTVRASDDPLPWKGTAHAGVTSVTIAGPDGESVAATALIGENQLKYVRGPLPAEAVGFTHVSVEVAVTSVSRRPRARAEEARLYLYRDGERLMDALRVELQRHGDMQVATFSSSLLRGETLRPDEFAVAFIGSVRSAAVASVTFARAEPSFFAPPAGASAGLPLVLVGEVSRRSHGLMPERPFNASAVLQRGERVRAFAALVPGSARPGERATLTVHARGTSGEVTEEFKDVGVNDWTPIELRSEELGAGPVDLSISIRSTVGDGLAIGVLAEPTVRRVTSDSSPPTVLLVTSDTHRADHIGVGNSDGLVSTPHIDALAGRGVHFLDCVAPTNVTGPSHVALMTGLHVRDTGILTNRDALRADAMTIAARFRDAGYETLATTSVFHLSQAKSGIGNGFDRINAPVAMDRPGQVAIETMQRWIGEAGAAPLFCWVHVYDAHTPYSPPAAYDRKYWSGGDPYAGPALQLGEAELAGWLQGMSEIEFPHAQYRAEIDFVDGMLGDLFDLPRVRAGITAFTADHGELFGEQGHWWTHAGLYPGIQHIPLVMSWPGAPAGARALAPVHLMDVGRTLVELAGIDPGDHPGRDLREVIETPPPSEPRFYLGAHHYIAAIEADGWFLNLTLIGHKTSTMSAAKAAGRVELYHLKTDPNYANDVVLENLERAGALRARLIQWLEDAPAERLNAGVTLEEDAADVAMLAALGYGGEASVVGEPYWDPEHHDPNWSANPWRLIFESEDMSAERARELLGR